MTAEETLCLAIDAGGTSTRALLIAADGDCVGYGRAGGGNPVSWGPEEAARSVTSAVAAALEHRRSGLVPSTASTCGRRRRPRRRRPGRPRPGRCACLGRR